MNKSKCRAICLPIRGLLDNPTSSGVDVRRVVLFAQCLVGGFDLFLGIGIRGWDCFPLETDQVAR